MSEGGIVGGRKGVGVDAEEQAAADREKKVKTTANKPAAGLRKRMRDMSS